MATGRLGTTPVLRTRWSKEPAGGTTSLSGLDDYSVSLVYEVGYEAVYQNGALLSRGNDYTATDGTTITLTNATVAGDIIEVFANNVVPLTDTYSQSVADGKFVNNTIVDAKGDLIVGSAADTFTRLAVGSANQVLTVDSATTSGLKWATPSSGLTLITRQTFSAVTGANIDNVFTSTYETYQIVIEECFSTVEQDELLFQLRYAGPTTQTASYYGNLARLETTYATINTNNGSQVPIIHNIRTSTGQASNGTIWINNVGNGSRNPILYAVNHSGSAIAPIVSSGFCLQAREYTGFRLTVDTGSLTAKVAVYGLAK